MQYPLLQDYFKSTQVTYHYKTFFLDTVHVQIETKPVIHSILASGQVGAYTLIKEM